MSFMFMYMYSNNLIIFYLMMYMKMITKNMYISTMMMFMTLIMMKMILFSMKEKIINYFFFMKKKVIMMMMLTLMLFFYAKSMMKFYIYFEMISMMIFMSIFFSSFSNQRLKASIYIFLYMGLSTFPMLVMLFFINEKTFMLILILGFMIKLPIMFFHLWLPKAHVEANFYDSMILASILLKLGGYGLMIMNINKKMNFFILWSILSILFMSMKILYLMDLKMVFAYSSIIHMNSMILMLMSNNLYTEKMFILMMISHAISSSMMFYLIGMIYEFTYSRSILINKSFMNNNLSLFLIMFMTMFINMAMPPFMNFFSEMYMIMSLINYTKKMLILTSMIMFMSLLFNLMTMKNMGMSKFSKFFKMNQMKMKNLFLFFEHMLLLILM